MSDKNVKEKMLAAIYLVPVMVKAGIYPTKQTF